MKKKIFIRFFAITLAAVLVMFAVGLVAVNLNTKNVVNERLKEETVLAAALMNEQSDFAVLISIRIIQSFELRYLTWREIRSMKVIPRLILITTQTERKYRMR